MERVGDVYLVEEINSNDIPETELNEFQEIKPLKALGYLNDDFDTEEDENLTEVIHIKEEEPELIQKFVRGEGEFPSFYTKLEPEEEESEDESQIEEVQNFMIESDYQSSDDVPSTSTSIKKPKEKRPRYKVTKRKRLGEEKRNRPRYARKCSVLTVALQGLMGEANLNYARGKNEMAEKLCLEIIRQNPMAPEPFLTLAEIYESRDSEKHLNFLTIAAHLNPHDRDQWIRIAEMHIAKGNLANARVFYSKAIKAIRKDYDLRLRKAHILEQLNDMEAAMWTYLKMVPLMPKSESELCLKTAKKVATFYHENRKLDLALEAMDGAYNVCASLFSMADLNLYMELLILNKKYAQVVKCLQERTSLQLEIAEDCKNKNMFLEIPENYLPDFRSKLCVSLIKLKYDHFLYYIVQNIRQHIPPMETFLNLYVDIAEALMQEHKYAEAIELLRPITDCEHCDNCPAFIWLRRAECLRQLNRYDEAIESYQNVLESAPNCYDAKLNLAALLKQQGSFKDAVKALEQAENSEEQPLHARLLYERCMMLKCSGDIDGYLEAGCEFLGRKSLKLRNREELQTFISGSQLYHLDGLKAIIQMRNLSSKNLAPDSLEFNNKLQNDITDLTVEDEYQLFLEILQVAFKHKKFSLLERLCFYMATTKRFQDFHHDLERIIILACYYNDDCLIGFSFLRDMISKDPTNKSLWNMLSLFFQKFQDVRYYRYLRRLYTRNPHFKQIRLYLGHYSLNCSSHKLALNIYSELIREQPTSLIALCIAVAFNQISLQKRVLKSAAPIGQAIAFAQKYAAMRRLECIGGTCSSIEDPITVETQDMVEQEICYNIGRIYHQAGILHLAVEYYERALRVTHPLILEHEQYLGLTQEIAYNLHLIYRTSGNINKARQLLYDYCVV